MWQDLSSFRMPSGFRGRSILWVQIWWFFDSVFFRNSPQFAYKFRANLLRIFGARIGRDVIIRPTVRITYPWRISIGDYAWIGDNAELYSLGDIHIGAHAVVSQHSYLCAGDHDHTQSDFPIRGRAIHIGAQAWVAAHVYIAPGVTIGEGSVIGARSSVFSDMPAGWVCLGSPCKPIKPRLLANGGTGPM